MKDRKEFSAFDVFENLRQIREDNRQNAYENKVCRKLMARMFSKDSEDRNYWLKRIGASSEPLSDLNEKLEPFRLHSVRMQSWSINDLLKAPSKIVKNPVWKEFAAIVEQTSRNYPNLIPAMIFYNSVIEQDMVLHAGSHLNPPNGYARIVRTSSSGEGTVIIDTLEGFMEVLGYSQDEV